MPWFYWWSHLEIDDRHILLSWSSEHDTCMTEGAWMGVISPSALTHSPPLFLLLPLAISLLLWRRSLLPSKKPDERRSLSSPLSISPDPSLFVSPCSLSFHISGFFWTMNRATCSQKPEFSELVISWTAGITRQHLTLVMKTQGAGVSFLFKPSSRGFPSPTL